MKQKQSIKLNESELRNIIKENIKKILNENERRDIFTLNIFDIENENSIDDMQYAYDYESEEEAIQAAREVAKKYADMDSVINVFVMAGEYMDAQGNIFGEPDAIYCVSNKDKGTTMQARKNAGYSRLETDEYIGENMMNENEFTPHGYSSDSNFGGKEIQLSDDGEMARLRTNYGDGPSKPTRWLKIYFNNDGVAYVMFKGRRLRLDQFMRY